MKKIIVIREKSNGGKVLDYYDTYLREDGTIDVTAMIDAGEFGDYPDEEVLDLRDCDSVTGFCEDLTHYTVEEFNTEEDIVNEFDKEGVSQKVGEKFLKYFYNGDEVIEFGYHDGSEYMEWHIRKDVMVEDE